MTTCLLFAEQEQSFINGCRVDEAHMRESVLSAASKGREGKGRGGRSRRVPSMELRRTRISVQTTHIRGVVRRDAYVSMLRRFAEQFSEQFGDFMTVLEERSSISTFHASLLNRLDYNGHYKKTAQARVRSTA